MKKIRTLDSLLDSLDFDHSWRLKELADLKILVRRSPPHIQSSMVRAGIPLAYAHWEGFVKNAVESYLNFVSNQKISVKALKPCLIALSKKRQINEFQETSKSRKHTRLVIELTEPSLMDAVAVLPSRVKTGNLKSEVFTDISHSIGLDIIPYESRFNFIDVRLLKRRNEIAHGSYLDIDTKSFKEIVNDVIELNRMFKSDIENLAIEEAYLL